MTAGYSGTPLTRKLGLKPGLRTWWDGMPATVAEEIFRFANVVSAIGGDHCGKKANVKSGIANRSC